MSKIEILSTVFVALFYLVVGMVFLLTLGEAIKGTWDLYFPTNKRWGWKELSTEERAFIAITMWAISPILYPIIILCVIASFLMSVLQGGLKLIFRFRSRHFDELAEKILK